MVWARHKPDRFDSFSAGAVWRSSRCVCALDAARASVVQVSAMRRKALSPACSHGISSRCAVPLRCTLAAGLVLMQLALPKLRTSNNLKTFSQQLAACNHDLDLWRDRCAAERQPRVSQQSGQRRTQACQLARWTREHQKSARESRDGMKCQRRRHGVSMRQDGVDTRLSQSLEQLGMLPL